MGNRYGGAITTFITLFALVPTGSLVAAFVKQIHADRFRTVGERFCCRDVTTT